MKEDILINGISVTELKKQREAIKKGASKVVAEYMAKARVGLEKLASAEENEITKEELDVIAKETLEQLEVVEIVAAVADVQFYLPWGGESCDDSAYSSLIEDLDGYMYNDDSPLNDLYSLLENMETDSCNWHESRC